MKITKAVITAAAPQQHALPLQTLVDCDGIEKSALRLIVEEVLAGGVEEICVIIQPDDSPAYKRAAGDAAGRIEFIEQDSPRGYADALYRAKEFAAGQPFLHLVGDHLYLSNSDRCCAKQLIEVASEHDCSVSAVQSTRESSLPHFGTIGGRRVDHQSNLFEVTRVREKPTPTQAEQELMIAGMRAGHYLCFFGMHVFSPAVLPIVGELLEDTGENVQLSQALSLLAGRERYLALEIQGTRHDIGVKYGLLIAQLSLALTGKDRDQILTELIDLLATCPAPLAR